MHPQVGWLSEDAHALQAKLKDSVDDAGLHCDLLVVGSGYGGAVAAARLALAHEGERPLRIIVIERGREYLPGMFPSRLGDLAGHIRFSRQDGERPRGPATALWDVRLGNDVNVVLGSGLGGGSLINAAVMERPEAAIWQSGWPSAIDADCLDAAYAKAHEMLGANRLPTGTTYPKLEALQHLGDGLPDTPEVERCQLAVSFTASSTPEAEVVQMACNGCGDCATGCNFQAKNSLDVNYLALAKRRGVSIYCGVLACRIERFQRDSWQLRWTPMDDQLDWAACAAPIRSRFLIVCAGSLGSTELLQRSQGPTGDAKRAPLRFSGALGSRFSTNGDMLAAAVKLPVKTQICADETAPFEKDGVPQRHVGPTITGMLRSGQGSSRFVAQEFAIPAPLRTLLAELSGSIGMLHSLTRFDWSLHSPWCRGAEPLSPSHHELDRTMVYGLMGDDGARGRLEPTRQAAALEETGKLQVDDDCRWDARIAVQWPEARREPLFEAQHAAMSAAYGSRDRGWYLPNPAWRPLPSALDDLARGNGVRGPLTTVHPLGGCPMGDNVDQGVVDWAGRVFDAQAPGLSGTAVLPGLVVLDGAIVPRSLGINPSLTIAALAEHAVPELARSWGLTLRANAPSHSLPDRLIWLKPEARPEQPATGIRLLEQVQGTLVLDGCRYWSEMQVRFMPVDDVAALARHLPRRVPFEKVVLRLYPDRLDREDEPQWRAQREVEAAPLWEVELSGAADVLFRHWSWFPDRVWRSRSNVSKLGAVGASFSFFTKLAIASNIGERRGIDYLLHVDSVSDPACPLRPGDRLRGRKVIDNDRDSNPWRQFSEMTLQWRRKSSACLAGPYRRIGRLNLDLRYFVRQRTALLSLVEQADMSTALADVAVFALFAVRVMLKIQLLKFIPPIKQPREVNARRPAELPGLRLERHDLRGPAESQKVLLSRYQSLVDPPRGAPIVLFHGLTASGSTFAHPSMRTNLVQYLCGERRDVWVVELPTSIAFEKRDATDLDFEDVADMIPGIIDGVRRRSDQPRVDVLAHCIGAAMFCRAVLGSTDLHSAVRSLTLSQVGPLVQMTPANQLRGYLASYLAQYLGTRMLDARPNFEPGGASGLGQTLLDALLASLPYPERDRERVLAEHAVAQGRPDFRVVRHRSDAMLGRLFELSGDSSVGAATLDALDDILGFVRVQTLAQVIHYTRLSMLTDSDGRNRQISSDALTERMGFPVLLLHGRRSGVFDWRGSLESYEWLRHSYLPPPNAAPARIERNDEKLHLGLDTDRQLCVFEKFGHQDAMIGERAAAAVFPVIGQFLRWTERPGAVMPTPVVLPDPAQRPFPNGSLGAPPGVITGRPEPTPWVASLPWIGPVVGWLRDGKVRGRIDVSFVLHPNPTHARTRFVALVPMRYLGGAWRHDTLDGIRLWDDFKVQPDSISGGLSAANGQIPGGDDGSTLLPALNGGGGIYESEWSDDTDDEPGVPPSLRHTGKDIGTDMREGSLTLDLDPSEVDGGVNAILLLTVHGDLPRRSLQMDWSYPNKGKSPGPDQASAHRAVRRFIANPSNDLESGLLRLPPTVIAARNLLPSADGQRQQRTESFTFAVASCQYPAGLLDGALAESSYRRLALRLKAPGVGSLPSPQLLLLLGDQVYVDESAGLFDPLTKRRPFDQIYERNFGLAAFRAVTSRLPTFMMLDDHEVGDNWQPPASGKPSADDQEALTNYAVWQASLSPTPVPKLVGGYSFQAAPGGWPLFVLDTRTQRQARTPEKLRQRHHRAGRGIGRLGELVASVGNERPRLSQIGRDAECAAADRAW